MTADRLGGAARISFEARTSVVEGGFRLWGTRSLWICDGSAIPTVGGVTLFLTIKAVALQTADLTETTARRGSCDLVAGLIGAVVSTYGGAAARGRLAAAFGRDLPAALVEDSLAVVLGAVTMVALW